MNELVALTDRQMATLRSTIANDCNAPEFNLFVEYARRIGLDPIRKQIIPIIFSANDPKKRNMQIVVSIDGLRTIAERVQNYRPDDEEPQYVYSDELKHPDTNPLGIEKCVVKAWKQDSKGDWYPVKASAYWDEYVPIKTWDGTAKIDSKTLWPKMPRLMIAKCAEALALRKGWPDQFAGIHLDAEFDRAKTSDIDATESVNRYIEGQRIEKVGGEHAIVFWLDDGGSDRIPVGKVADEFLKRARACTDLNELANLRARNSAGLKEFWARAGSDALALKAELEKLEDKLREPATV